MKAIAAFRRIWRAHPLCALEIAIVFSGIFMMGVVVGAILQKFFELV